MNENVAHVTPEPDDPPHNLHGFCWCSPVVEDVPPDGHVYIHRRTIDSPHIEAAHLIESPTEGET